MGGKKFYFETANKVPNRISIDVTKGGIAGKGGENLSSRIVVQMKDVEGKVVKGYFTENEYVDARKTFQTRFKEVAEKPENEIFKPIFDRFKNRAKYNALILSIFNDPLVNSKMPPKGDLFAPTLGLLVEQDKEVAEAVKNFFTDSLRIPEEQVNVIMDPNNRKALGDYMAKLASEAINAETLEYNHIRHHAMGAKENINRRNNAMSDYAWLIGENEFIAKSIPATITSGDKTIYGSFMYNAEGLSKEQLNVNTKGFVHRVGNTVKAKRLVLTEEAIKQISKAQVLDFLCANYDRHPGNFIYEVDTTDPDNVKITGVKLIDNDASFGDLDYEGAGAIGYMSKVEDIKIMDATMAQRILKMDSAEMENMIRRIGLNAKEVEGAHLRLKALQDRIKKGDIKLLNKKEDWGKYLDSDAYAELCYANEVTGSFNAFDNVKFAIGNYNRTKDNKLRFNIQQEKLKKAAAAKAKAKGKAPEPEKKPEIGYAEIKNIQDGDALKDHYERLAELHAQISEVGGIIRTPGFKELYERIQDSMNLITSLQNKLAKNKDDVILAKQLGPMDRNALAMSLKAVAEAGDNMAKLNSKEQVEYRAEDVRLRKVNIALNAKAFCEGARKSVLEDSLEAEKILASKMAADLNKILGGVRAIRTTDQTVDKLSKTLSNVDSIFVGSSPQFKAMVTAFKELKNLPNNATDAAKKEKYDAIAEVSKQYLEYKTPGGRRQGLSEYALKRVRFAEKMQEFAEVNSENIVRAKEKKVDLVKLKEFNDNCKSMIDAVKQSTSPEAKTAAIKAIMSNKDEFVKGYREMLTISEKYPDDPQLQTVCEKFAKSGPISDYMYAYTSGLKSISMNASSDVMKNLGLDEADAARKQQLSLRAKFAEPKVADSKAPQIDGPALV